VEPNGNPRIFVQNSHFNRNEGVFAMAMSPGSRQRDTRTASGGQPEDPALNPMQEPLGSTDRPVPRTSDDNDVNLAREGTGYISTTRSAARDPGRGFTTTFAIVAAVLVAAFLVALYFGSERSDLATAPDAQPPVADTAPGTADDTTGSTTTPAAPQESAPATGGGTGTGGGTTAPANP
jgi:hypothetical protein